MRYLAIDLGDQRTGLAIGDDETMIIGAAGVLEIPRESQEDRLLEALDSAVREHGAQQVVIGLPLNMDGTEGGRARLARMFAERIAERTDCVVHLQDERLTTYAAEQHLNRSGRTHRQKKKLRDQLAAIEILRDFLQSQRNQQHDS